MMKIAHLADTHLGYRQYGLNERENDFYDAFNEVIDDIIDKDVDIVLHSGDLFEHPKPPIKALLVAQQGFEKLMNHGIPVYVIAGNHDMLQKSNNVIPQELYENDNFHIISHRNLMEIIDNEIFIGGLEYLSTSYKDYIEKKLKEIKSASIGYPYKILMLHGGVDKYFKFEPEFDLHIIPEDFDYYAMGHIHTRVKEEFKGGILSYPGSTEFRNKDEWNKYTEKGKGYNLLTLSDGNINVEFVDLPATRKFYIREIEYPKLEDKLLSLQEEIKNDNYPKKPVVFITVKKGNFDKSEVHEKIMKYLGEYCLIIKSNYDIMELIGGGKKGTNPDEYTPENLIRKGLTELGNETIELGVSLYKQLSVHNKEEARKVAHNTFDKLYHGNTDKEE